MMAPWSLCIVFMPLALGDSMPTHQVQPFVASLTSELQRLLPDKTVAAPSHFDPIPENVTALLPKDISNSTALGLLSAFGTAAPNGIIPCILGWAKSAPARDFKMVFDIVMPLGGSIGFAILGLEWCSEDGSSGACLVLGALGALAGLGLGLVSDVIGERFDVGVVALVLCILHIEPPHQVTLDTLKAFAKDQQQMASFGRLLRDGHGFEAGFKVGSVLQEAWSQKETQQQAVLV